HRACAHTLRLAALGPRPAGRGAADPPVESPERGVYRSTDGGRAWARVLPADGSAGESDVYLDYQDPQIVFALLTAGGGAGAPQAAAAGTGVYKSADGGAAWQPIAGRGRA